MSNWTTVLVTAAVGAVVSVIVTSWFTSKQSRGFTSSVDTPPNGGTWWTSIHHVSPYGLDPDLDMYGEGAGKQASRTSFNGQIYTNRFTKTGANPNYPANYEQSYAHQSATKNPFANGPFCDYAYAVNAATQDPTNQATPLVYAGASGVT